MAHTFFIVEASHLFRAGDKFQTQFFVLDVVNFLKKELGLPDEAETIVLHGSQKADQAERYASALERFGAKVIRMKPIDSAAGNGAVFYKPTWYCHKLMGTEIPKGSNVVLIGFHNIRYLSFLEKYQKDFKFYLAAFTTPSRKQGFMSIPAEFKPLLKQAVNLDEHVSDIKAEFKKAKKKQ